MAALITTLIDKRDNVEIMLEQIALILAVESAHQVILAFNAVKENPDDWKLRVYVERANPWDEWLHGNEVDVPDQSPVINVSFDNENFDASRSDPVERQMASATYNIDCYGYGISSDNGDGTHVAGDRAAAIESMRAARLVRNILMAGPYTYLANRGIVSRRWPTMIGLFVPPKNERTIDNVRGCRIALQVDFNEFSPQVEGQIIELISAQVTRAADGALLVQTDLPIT